VEVYNEKLIDMVGYSKDDNQEVKKTTFDRTVLEDNNQQKKLEIRTNRDGDTMVQGLESCPVKNLNDVIQIWKESLSHRAMQLKKKGEDLRCHEASSNLIVTLEVKCKNLKTGVGTIGRIQFVDLAGSDVVPRRGSSSSNCKPTVTDDILAPIGNKHEWKFVNKSIAHLLEVINARSQFSRSVPYRNSTLTHLLRDSLTSDTKVLLFLCVSSDSKDLQETANTLRFGTKMRKVVIGKATKHTIS